MGFDGAPMGAASASSAWRRTACLESGSSEGQAAAKPVLVATRRTPGEPPRASWGGPPGVGRSADSEQSPGQLAGTTALTQALSTQVSEGAQSTPRQASRRSTRIGRSRFGA